MGTITAIEKQKRRQIADVYLDGVFSLSLRLESIAIAGLRVGFELDDGLRRQIEAEDQRRSAIEYALRSLAVLPRSEKDLRDRMRRRGLSSAASDAAITRMRELGYLNDEAFARFWVDARQAATPRSRRALAFELSSKGIDRELAQTTVEDVSDEDAAYAAARRRMRALRNLDRQAFAKRLGSFLASRGFGYGIARGAIDRCWAELAEQTAEV